MKSSITLFNRACEVMPGGVNSPVRAFKAVEGTPRFIESALGCKLYDVEGNTYIDYVGSWGPMILGHQASCVIEAVVEATKKGLSFGAATEKEVEMAELICECVPQIESIRMVNSGTEAVMSAIRLARGYTKKDKIIKFAGCYHGHSDSMLVKAGSGALTLGVPDSSGVTKGVSQDTLVANYNDLESVENLLKAYKDEVAAIIVEPVAANMGVVPPQPGFLEGLRALCNQYQSLLIFDEVITGFRLALGGAMSYFNVEADLVTYGKIIGGGLPVGAYGGRKEIMAYIAPLGPVYQAGTLSGNPLAMAAGMAMLKELKQHPQIYTLLNQLATDLKEGLKEITDYTVNQVGSLVTLFFTKDSVIDYKSALKSDLKQYAQYFKGMLSEGIYIAPAQFEALFLSAAHTKEAIETTLQATKKVLKNF